MREITLLQLYYISGAGGAPATTANVVGEAAIIGALGTIAAGAAMGTPVGPGGMIVGAAVAGITTAVGATVGGPGTSNSASSASSEGS